MTERYGGAAPGADHAEKSQRADAVRAQALEVSAGWAAPDAPDSWRLTAAVFGAIAAHDELVNRLAELPADRLPALLASAAVAYLVRRDRPVPLAAYFPEPGGTQPPFNEGFFKAADEFFSARMDDISEVCQGRHYQMNEAGRCCQIALGMAAAAGGPDPIALVDLGTGAGLGLQVDRYSYRVGDRTAGPEDAGLRLRCEVRGRLLPPPADVPPVAERVGIELDPVDPDDPDARAWLEACSPPEASALARLTAAVDVTRRHSAPVIAGDALDVLPRVLAGLPRRREVVVTDAYMAVFLPPERRTRLIEILADAGQIRPVTWLSLDPLVPLGPSGTDSVQGVRLPTELVSDYQSSGVFAVLGARRFGGNADGYRDRHRTDDDHGGERRLLARAHPSGQWIEWLDPQTAG